MALDGQQYLLDILDRRRAPASLRIREDLCGPIAAWQALRFFDKRAHARRLIELCGWRPQVGTFAIGVAVAIAKYGLRVEFQSDRDPQPQPPELPLYDEARRLGVSFKKPQSLGRLLKGLKHPRLPVLLFEHGSDSFGHFAILRGRERGYLVLSDEGLWLRPLELEMRRRARAVLRQTIIVSPAV